MSHRDRQSDLLIAAAGAAAGAAIGRMTADEDNVRSHMLAGAIVGAAAAYLAAPMIEKQVGRLGDNYGHYAHKLLASRNDE